MSVLLLDPQKVHHMLLRLVADIEKGSLAWDGTLISAHDHPSPAPLAPPSSVTFVYMAGIYNNSRPFCSLSEWSVRHIHDIFEASSDEDALRAVSSTFSDNVRASVNGAPLSREGINQMVLAMRKGSSGLKVHWHQALQVPHDPLTNRDGSFGGVYTIRGIKRILPGTNKLAEYERLKTVTVKIESESNRLDVDSRRIVMLAFVASDIRVDRQASL